MLSGIALMNLEPIRKSGVEEHVEGPVEPRRAI
jgi:hypothetical protein